MNTPPKEIGDMFNGIIAMCGDRCLPAFIFKHGVTCTYAPLPDNIAMMTPRECFRNAFRTMLAHLGQLTYCEGYAHSVIPTHHAWCIDKNGKVVDPTWRNIPDTVEYFGIPFEQDFVLQTTIANGYYGLLGDFGCRNVVEADPQVFIAKRWRKRACC